MLKNIGWMSIATALRMASGFVLFVVLARALGTLRFGELNYMLAVAGLAVLPVNYGFGLQLLREYGVDVARGERVMLDTVAAKVVLACVVGIVASVLAPLTLEYPGVFLMLLAMFIAESFTEHLNFYLRARKRFHVEAYLATLSAGLGLLLIGGAAVLDPSIQAVAIAFLASRAVVLVVASVAAGREFRAEWSEFRAAVARTRATLKSGFAYASDFFVSAINSTLDSLLVGALLGPRALGLYQAGMRLLQGVVAFGPSIAYAYLPQIAAEHQQRVKGATASASLLRKMIVVGSAGALALAAAPNWLAVTLYGPQYLDLGHLLPWFGLALLLRFVAAAHGAALTAIGAQVSRATINGLSVVILISGIAFSAYFGSTAGVVFSLCTSYGFLCVAYAIAMRRATVAMGWNTTNALLCFIAVAGTIVRGVST